MVKVSVIMPVYDCVKYLRTALESIGNQTFQDFEMILVNDACFDGSEKLIEVYAMSSNRIKVITHPYNLGVAESLNDGIVAAEGEYIAVQHSDDLSFPTRLEKQVQYLDAHPDRVLVGAWIQYIDENGKPKKKDGWWLRQVKNVPDDPVVIREKLLLVNCLPHTTVMFRRSMPAISGFYDQEMVPAEDLDMWLRASEKYDLGIIQEVLCQYRVHAAQISNTEGGMKMISKAAIAVTKAKLRRGL